MSGLLFYSTTSNNSCKLPGKVPVFHTQFACIKAIYFKVIYEVSINNEEKTFIRLVPNWRWFHGDYIYIVYMNSMRYPRIVVCFCCGTCWIVYKIKIEKRKLSLACHKIAEFVKIPLWFSSSSLHFNKTEKLYSFRVSGFRALVSEIPDFRNSGFPAFRESGF